MQVVLASFFLVSSVKNRAQTGLSQLLRLSVIFVKRVMLLTSFIYETIRPRNKYWILKLPLFTNEFEN